MGRKWGFAKAKRAEERRMVCETHEFFFAEKKQLRIAV
jgi:hypothetical protein